MGVLKPKEVEITLRVRVPKWMSPAKAKYEISQQWYGKLDCYSGKPDDPYHEITLVPRWQGARVVRKVRA
jgi:hypothetical protein